MLGSRGQGFASILRTFSLEVPLRLAGPVKAHPFLHPQKRRLHVSEEHGGREEVDLLCCRHIPADLAAADDRPGADSTLNDRMLSYY